MIKYAWQMPDRELVYIDNVENGVKCNCICPKCSAKLNAKNGGNILDHHFAHINSEECAGAAETVLHLLAKEVFIKTKRLMLPCYKDNDFSHELNVCRDITFDKVLLEKDIQTIDICIRPDAVAIIGGKEIYVEFANTHFVKPEKKAKIRVLNIPCVEIDISGQEIDEDKLSKLFISKSPLIYWINNPQMEEIYQKYCIEKEKKETRRQRIETDSSSSGIAYEEDEKELERLCWDQQQNKKTTYNDNEKRIESIIMSWQNGNSEEFANRVISLLKTPYIACRILQYVGTYQGTNDAPDFLAACYIWETPFEELYNKIDERKIKDYETLAWLWKIGYRHHQFHAPYYNIDWANSKVCFDEEYLYDCLNELDSSDIRIYLTLFNNLRILNIIGCIKYNHIFFGKRLTWSNLINSNRKFSNISVLWGYIDIALDGFYHDGLSMREYLKKSDSKIKLERSNEEVDESSDLFKALSLLFPDVYKPKRTRLF